MSLCSQALGAGHMSCIKDTEMTKTEAKWIMESHSRGVCVYVCLCVCKCECMCVQVSVEGLGCCSLGTSHLDHLNFFETALHILAWSLSC